MCEMASEDRGVAPLPGRVQRHAFETGPGDRLQPGGANR